MRTPRVASLLLKCVCIRIPSLLPLPPPTPTDCRRLVRALPSPAATPSIHYRNLRDASLNFIKHLIVIGTKKEGVVVYVFLDVCADVIERFSATRVRKHLLFIPYPFDLSFFFYGTCKYGAVRKNERGNNLFRFLKF
jgi:hypothetical protein